jgi:hypothetical protein
MFEEGSLVLAALFLLVGLGVFVSPHRDVDICGYTACVFMVYLAVVLVMVSPPLCRYFLLCHGAAARYFSLRREKYPKAP